MKVVYASRTTGVHDRRFLRAISSLGFEVVHLLVSKEGPGDTTNEVEVYRGWGGTELRAVWHLIQQEFGPNLVHAGPVQEVAYPLLQIVDVPLIPMSWGSDLLNPADPGHLWAFAAGEVLAQSSTLFADCRAVSETAKTLGFKGTVFEFPWGVDLDDFDLTPRAAKRAATFVSMRGWEPIYDPMTIARAFVRLAADESDARLVMCGGGSMEDELRSALSEVSPGQVAWRGCVQERDVPDVLRSSDVYLASSLSDGSSVSLLQALASGLPAIVSDIPGNREWVSPGVNGWLFPPGDTDGLYFAMKECMAVPAALHEMSENNIKSAVLRADWKKNREMIGAAYEQVAGSR